MDSSDFSALADRFAGLTTPLVADGCLRAGIPLRFAPPGLRAAFSCVPVAGRALPARHSGSVDAFLEALHFAVPGDVLVVDIGGRTDEACFGDLTALEARAHGAAGIVVWGLHRDTAELAVVGLPVYTYGSLPAGPRRLDPREPDAIETVRFGNESITAADGVFADADGALFVALGRVSDVLAAAEAIAQVEREQARRVGVGETLSSQLRFAEFLERRRVESGLTFRGWLREVRGATEE